MKRLFTILVVISICALSAASWANGTLIIYSGRGKPLVQPIVDRFTEATGVQVKVKYGDSAEMAATILEEGRNTPADLIYVQDAGALGALAREGLLRQLPKATLSLVEPRFRSPEGVWVGASGRARVVVYNTLDVKPAELPASILGFTDPRWKGKIGWAPLNGSFQAFVTAMRVRLGEPATRDWLRAMLANKPRSYPKNSAIVAAVGAGEVEVGFVNHYYLYRFIEQQGDGFPAANYYPANGDVGALINVAGAGILKTSEHVPAAERFVAFLLENEAQRILSHDNHEYPLLRGFEAPAMLKPLSEIETPDIDLSDLADLEGTLIMLQDLGVYE